MLDARGGVTSDSSLCGIPDGDSEESSLVFRRFVNQTSRVLSVFDGSDVAGVLAIYGAALSTVIAARQLFQYWEQRWFRVHVDLNAPDVRRARRTVREELDGVASLYWSAEQRDAAHVVWTSYDQAGKLYGRRKRRVLLDDSWGTSIVNLYRILVQSGHGAEGYAGGQTRQQFFSAFGVLYEAAEEHLKRHARDPRYVAALISGGQSGVDRAALRVARKRGLPYYGWVPAGGWATDRVTPPGIIVDFPNLRECPHVSLVPPWEADASLQSPVASAPAPDLGLPEPDTAERTRRNVRSCDALLTLDQGDPTDPGTGLALQTAAQVGTPVKSLTLPVEGSQEWATSITAVADWLRKVERRDLRSIGEWGTSNVPPPAQAARRELRLNVSGPRDPRLQPRAELFLDGLLEAVDGLS